WPVGRLFRVQQAAQPVFGPPYAAAIAAATSSTACCTTGEMSVPWTMLPGWMPSSATSAPSSVWRYAATICRGSVCVEALTPEISSHSSQRTVPGGSSICAASTNRMKSGEKRRSAPVTFSGAGPASMISSRSCSSASGCKACATATPAASSPLSTCPTPTTATRGGGSRSGFVSLLASFCCQRLCDVIRSPVDVQERLARRRGKLPLIVGERDSPRAAACGALRAVRALIQTIPHDEALCLTVEHDHVERVRGAVLGAQAAAGAQGRIPHDMAAQAFGCFPPFKRVEVRGGLLEKPVHHVAE